VQRKINAGAEVPRSQRNIARRSLKDIKAEASERGEWIMAAYKNYGYSMREIADFAKVHYSLVSKIIKKRENS
jgi:DNA-binding MarR family transcriptional regulator